uniref:Uncharacterized protein n=1 Tax=Oryza brachyantha TaxID=4533 RepID=J3MI36_ORYBR
MPGGETASAPFRGTLLPPSPSAGSCIRPTGCRPSPALKSSVSARRTSLIMRQLVHSSFLHLMDYGRLLVIKKFVQSPKTDRVTVRKTRDAIDNQAEITVQSINYTKSGS